MFDAGAPPDVPCGTVPPQDQPAAIHLCPGWNLIGEPFLAGVAWEIDRIMVRSRTGVVRTLRESGIVKTEAWGLRQDESDPYTGTYYPICDASEEPDASHGLLPWRAFWVYSGASCDLILPPPDGEAVQCMASVACRPDVCARVLSRSPGPPPVPQ